MPHANVSFENSPSHLSYVDDIILLCQRLCNEAKLSTTVAIEMISIINLIFDGDQHKPSGLTGIEVRTLANRYTGKPYFRIQFKYLTPTSHPRMARIFVQQDRNGTYISQLYIRSKDMLHEVSASSWKQLEVQLRMMVDQYKLLEHERPSRRSQDEKRHHPKGYRKV